MCPACITTVALIVTGVTSTGGLTALVVKKRRSQTGANNIDVSTQTKGEQNESCKSSVTR
jgi:hypothetical protein